MSIESRTDHSQQEREILNKDSQIHLDRLFRHSKKFAQYMSKLKRAETQQRVFDAWHRLHPGSGPAMQALAVLGTLFWVFWAHLNADQFGELIIGLLPMAENLAALAGQQSHKWLGWGIFLIPMFPIFTWHAVRLEPHPYLANKYRWEGPWKRATALSIAAFLILAGLIVYGSDESTNYVGLALTISAEVFLGLSVPGFVYMVYRATRSWIIDHRIRKFHLRALNVSGRGNEAFHHLQASLRAHGQTINLRPYLRIAEMLEFHMSGRYQGRVY